MSSSLKIDLNIESYKKMPNGQLRGVCPFRENHTAVGTSGGGAESFFMSPKINAYHCFSCGKKGRMSVLLQEKFGLTLQATLSYVNNFQNLADNLGSRKGLKRVVSELTTLKEVANSEQKTLLENLPQKINLTSTLTSTLTYDSLDYFLLRGFSKETLDFFKVGCIENYTKEDIFYLKVYTMPVYFLGNIVEIWYRANVVFSENSTTKRLWVESKESKEKNYLYNFDHAATFNEVVICEGQTDCWKIVQAIESQGLNLGVVATLGTHFTDFQLILALNSWKKFTFAYDNDLAGMTAALKFANKLIAYGVDKSKINFYYYTESSNKSNKDPAEMSEKSIILGLKTALSISQYRYNRSSFINNNI